jgi:hypothetical protein
LSFYFFRQSVSLFLPSLNESLTDELPDLRWRWGKAVESVRIREVREAGNVTVRRNLFLLRDQLRSWVSLSPSWEAFSCVATQEIPKMLRNPMINCRVHKSIASVV